MSTCCSPKALEKVYFSPCLNSLKIIKKIKGNLSPEVTQALLIGMKVKKKIKKKKQKTKQTNIYEKLLKQTNKKHNNSFSPLMYDLESKKKHQKKPFNQALDVTDKTSSSVKFSL